MRRVFENIGAVLAEAEMDFANGVKFTNYLVNPDDLVELRVVRLELWEEYFLTETFRPTRCSLCRGLRDWIASWKLGCIAVSC